MIPAARTAPRPAARGKRRPTRRLGPAGRVPGVTVCLALAVLATLVASLLPLGSGPVCGIVLGMGVATVVGPRPVLAAGVSTSASVFLRAAVVLLGAELPIGTVLSQGAASLPVILVTLTGCLVVARQLGRLLGIRRDLGLLVGVGTAICGASAIAAVTPIVRARRLDVAYAVATIFLFNVLAVFLFPPLGHLLGMSQHGFGMFAGTAVNDISSVVAVAGIYGHGALHEAVIVKLARTLMIVPICLVLARRNDRRPGPVVGIAVPAARRSRIVDALTLVPRFLFGFLFLATLRGVGLIPSVATGPLASASTFLITAALCAVGLSIEVGALRRVGSRPLLLGLLLWVTVSTLSLLVQKVTGAL